MYAVPTGMDRTLRKIGIPDSRILPMQWWEEVIISHDGKVRQRRQLSEPASETMTLSGDKDKLGGADGTELTVLPAISFEPSRHTSDPDQKREIQLVEVGEDEVKMSLNGEKESLKDLALGGQHIDTPVGQGRRDQDRLPSVAAQLAVQALWNSFQLGQLAGSVVFRQEDLDMFLRRVSV